MVARRRSAGFSTLEATIALVVVAVVACGFLWSGPQQIRATGTAFRTAAARRLAAGVLEQAHDAALVAGEHDVELPAGAAPRDARASRSAREVEPGLWEVEAVVRWTEPGEHEPRESRLVTWVARERNP